MLSFLRTWLSRLTFDRSSTPTTSGTSATPSSQLVRPPGSSGSLESLEASLTRQLRADEGEVLHAYTDSLGYLTIGVGRLIDQRKGGGITAAESAYLLQNDISSRVVELRQRIAWFDRLDEARQGVLLNMSFQMGVDGLLAFKNTLAMIERGDYDAAADGMLESLWAKQTPARAKRLSDQMRTGRWIFQ